MRSEALSAAWVWLSWSSIASAVVWVLSVAEAPTCGRRAARACGRVSSSPRSAARFDSRSGLVW